MHYRPYHPGDFETLYAIEEICFQPPQRFPRGYMLELLKSANAATWIAEQDSRMAGFAIVEWTWLRSEKIAYIATIEVAPEFRRRGIAIALLQRLESSARAAACSVIWLHVDEHNRGAIQLYRSQGYEKEGRRAHYYGQNRAAQVFAKILAS